MRITDVHVVPISDDGPYFTAKLNGFDIKVSYPSYQTGDGGYFHPYMVWALAGLGSTYLEKFFAAKAHSMGRAARRECPVHPNYTKFRMVVEAPGAVIDVLIDTIQQGTGRFLWGSL